MTPETLSIVQTVIGGVITVAVAAVPIIVSRYLGNKQDAAVLSNAIANSLGAIQNAVEAKRLDPAAAGVQYVLDHAGPEAQRLGVTPDRIASKIGAKQGLQSLAEKAGAVPVTVAGVSPGAVAETKGL